MSMAKPPSPAMAITWRPGCANCNPIAVDIAVAMVPCSRLPNMRRLPFALTMRNSHTSAVLSSPVNSVSAPRSGR
jgi:hypothetical protein